MERFNLIFIETKNSKQSLLGRTAADFVMKEFADFQAVDSRIVKESAYKARPDGYYMQDAVNVILTLDMPLLRKSSVLHYVALLRMRKVTMARLGSKDSESLICMGKATDEGIFVNDEDFLKIDDTKSYNMVYNLLKDRILDSHLLAGVTIVDKNTTFIDDTAKIEIGAKILPFSRIEGDSCVKSGATVSSSYVRNSVVENGASVEMSHVVDSCICRGATVGPFARLRGAQIGCECRVGDFVEVKASKLGKGVKASHLSYVGDADVGDGTNVGCGTVFCNYDGKAKNKTTVGSRCFLGANTNLIAPVVVGDNAFIAAGTTVTRDVEESTFTIGRVKQDTKTITKPQS